MITFLLLLSTWFVQRQEPSEVLVGVIEVYISKDTEQFTAYALWEKTFFLSDCDLLYFICNNPQLFCDSLEFAKIQEKIELYKIWQEGQKNLDKTVH
jgi:hypothetical protein